MIRANGAGAVAGLHKFSRGGAGGSVWITAGGTISGDGAIEAHGGVSGNSLLGSGGGGAIAVEYAAASGTVLDNLRALGGDNPIVGAGGTVYLLGPTATWGELLVDNGLVSTQGASLPGLGSGTAAAGTTGALLVTDRASAIPPYFAGHWVEVSDAGGTVKGTWRIASVSGVSATLEPAGAETISLAPGDLWRGVYRFDTVTQTGGTTLTSSDPVFENGIELNLSTTN